MGCSVYFRCASRSSRGCSLGYVEGNVIVVCVLAFMGCSSQFACSCRHTSGLLGEIWEVMDDVVLAISDASEVRVAHLLGLGRPKLAKYSSDKSILLGVISGFVMSAVLGVLQTSLPKWLTNDGILQRMLTNLMPIVCLALAVLSFGSMSYSILCSQGRTPLATTVSGCGSIFVTLPLASVSTFHFNFDLQALASCLLLGYASSGFVNSLLMLTSNWKRVSRTVRRRTKQLELTMRNSVDENHDKHDAVFVREDNDDKGTPDYDSYDFNELPLGGKCCCTFWLPSCSRFSRH